MRQLCEWKGVRIIEAEACPEHIHMLVEKPPKMAVSSFMGYLKGKSSTMPYEQFGELKYKYRSREFWCRGYYEETAGKNAGRIQEYIKNQLKEDERTVNDPAKRPVYGQQVTVFTQLADRICTFTRPRGIKGYARISKTPGFAGGCLFSVNSSGFPSFAVGRTHKLLCTTSRFCSTAETKIGMKFQESLGWRPLTKSNLEEFCIQLPLTSQAIYYIVILIV